MTNRAHELGAQAEVVTDDAALLAHVGRLLFERERLRQGCKLCDALIRRLGPQIIGNGKP